MNPVRKDMELLSNSMATYAHITENTESFALYFMLGVCFGLLLALTLLILTFACSSIRNGGKKTPASDSKDLKAEEEQLGKSDEEGEEEERDVTVAHVNEQHMGGENVFNSADELARARRLEARERIVREIWRNGQPDILVTGTGTLGRVHYH